MSADVARAATSMPPDFKVAFLGDQGRGASSVAVLQLIRDEGADMVLHQGDFDYADDPDAWDQQISNVLGPDFPYFASIGNHDCTDGAGCSGPGHWTGYQQKLAQRLDRVAGASCAGDLGVKSTCTYQGLFFILSGVGTRGTDHAAYIKSQLDADGSTWRICSWHENQRLMQVGGKTDEVGWDAYEECRKGGAIIATAHEHSYSRTHLLDNVQTQSIASTSTTLRLERGKTFAFVSGLGGQSIRPQIGQLAANQWWAAVYTAAQGANFGALFCTFNEGGIVNRAHCYFKDIGGSVPDSFDILTSLTTGVPVPGVSHLAMVVLAGLFLSLGFRLSRRRAARQNT